MADGEAKFSVRKVGAVTVVRPRGPHISELPYIDELGDELEALLATAAPPDLLIDFADVAFVSSSFLGKIVKLSKLTGQRGGRLRLCGLQPRFLEILELTQIDKLAEICPSLDDALGPQD
ncbi:MAG: STAS domain-containing protein [Candidatus Brocadiae bacterium]|nr:STAS domain-containing protein [Candidatus Brocadiia bacterium]